MSNPPPQSPPQILFLLPCFLAIFNVILCNHIMDLHMWSLGTIALEGYCCVFYAKRHKVYWGLTYCSFYYYSDLISHTHKDIQHTKGPTDWHIHINIYKHNLSCAHSDCLYYTEWIICWYQNLLYRIPHKLITCRSHMSLN